MRSLTTTFFVAALFLILLPFAVSAHASMESLYATSGEYIIDIGYDPITPQVGKRFLIDIALRTESETGPIADYDSVWVRMSRDRATYFATGVAQSAIGPTTLVLMLPESAEGPMTLSLRFEKDGDALAEHTFDLSVLPAETGITTREYVLGGSALSALGIALYLFISRKRYAQPPVRGDILTK